MVGGSGGGGGVVVVVWWGGGCDGGVVVVSYAGRCIVAWLHQESKVVDLMKV